MQVRTFETANNTYYLGYGRTAKTTYEQQREHKRELRYKLLQKVVGALFITVCISLSYISKDGSGLILAPIGLYPLLTKQQAFIL